MPCAQPSGVQDAGSRRLQPKARRSSCERPGERTHHNRSTTSGNPMNASRRRPWVRAALLLGAVYFLVGRLFALPADHVQAWRFAAWMVSGAAYAAHVGWEHSRLRCSSRLAAVHVAVAVAIGAFALAVAGMIHSLSTASAIRPAWFLALVLWPAFTAVPAFIGALVAGAVLRAFRGMQARDARA
jgi:hypothetical protein